MKNTLALVGLGFFTTISSAAMFPYDSEGEDIWQVEGQLIFANQSNNLAQFWGADSDGGGTVPNNLFTVFNDAFVPDPEERWGFGGRLGYVFESHKYDVQLRYLGINTSEQENGTIESKIPFDNDQSFSFNSAELMFGNYYKLSKRLILRASYGVAFADIVQDSTTHFSNTTFSGSTTAYKTKFRTSFVGAGPKVMADGDFRLYDSFSVVGSMGLGLLYGESESNIDINAAGAQNFDAPVSSSNDRVSTLIDGKLGFRYGYTATDDYTVNVEAGYKLAAYLDAMQDEEVGMSIPSGGVFPTDLYFDQDGNYVYSGPYINVGVDFM